MLRRWVWLAAVMARTGSAQTVGPTQGLYVSPAQAEQRAPAIAFYGTSYVLAFEEDLGTGVDLRFVRIDGSDGAAIIDNPPLDLAVGPGSPTAVALAPAPGGRVVAAWTDPRDGLLDEVYVASIATDTGAVTPPNGRRLTTNVADESVPAIACGSVGCLVAYTAVQGGQTRLMGRRIGFDGSPVDPEELDLVPQNGARKSDPTVSVLGSDYVVAFEDDRAGPAGDLFAELYARTLPMSGTVTSTGAIRVVSGAFRQSDAELLSVGSNVLLTWQDQRTAAVDGLEIATSSLDSALGTRLGPTSVLPAPRDQLFPHFAAGPASVLLIAEDFRFGAVGQIVGAQIDFDGRQLGAPFPVLTSQTTLFEHALAKGPGVDFLVAAVVSGTPHRIVFRLVRDELPASALSAPVSPMPADGVTPAVLDFGVATGPSGFVVADGARFTVSVSHPDVAIDTADLDGSLAGVQTEAHLGVVRVELRSTRVGVFDVAVEAVRGTSRGLAAQVFENVAPIVRNVSISPASPGSDDDLTLAYEYFDVNGDPETGTTIRWSNPALMAQFDGQLVIPSSATQRGETWRAQIVPNDGHAAGPLVFSPSVPIGNSAPSASMLRIRPEVGARDGTELDASYSFFDADGDLESGTRLGWTESGVSQVGLDGMRSVPGSNVHKGQVWQFIVEPSDGVDFGPIVRSATIAIENTPPVASAGLDLQVLERRGFRLDASGSIDVDGDPLSFRFTQESGPALAIPAAHGATVALEAPSVTGTTVLTFAVEVSDGTDTDVDLVVVELQPVPDPDADGLDDEEEAQFGTLPGVADTDRDGLKDGEEFASSTRPLDPDSDDDGVRDGAEAAALEDLDGDTLIGALDPDSDGDGLFDGTESGVTEPIEGTDEAADHFVADSDHATTTSPTLRDTDGDGLDDGVEDADHDGALDPGESDPLDRTSLAGCTATLSCPSDVVCRDGACRAPAGDATLMCVALATRGLECCVGSCRGGTPRAPRCEVDGSLEVCGADAITCTEGSCSAPASAPKNDGDGGCGCRVSRSGSVSPLWLLAILLVLRRQLMHTSCRPVPRDVTRPRG